MSDGPAVLVVDNYDSFAYNLVQYVGAVLVEGGGDPEDVLVRRNDAVDLAEIRRLDPDGIVVSPGPGTPADAGVSVPIFAELSYPTLGVCLGHQALCAAAGADVVEAESVVHGKASRITHDGTGVFAGLPDPLEVGRYHSLAVDRANLPAELVPVAQTVADDGEKSGSKADPDAQVGDPDSDVDRVGERGLLMAVRHRSKPHVGVQFHPESILTDDGQRLVANFCARCGSDQA